MNSGFSWLNDLMLWLARWIPRIQLIKATHEGVLFGPGGAVSVVKPGLTVYWPLTHELQTVSTRTRSVEIAAQVMGRECLQVVVVWRIADPKTSVLALNNVGATLDDRIQQALMAAYDPEKTNDAIAADVRARVEVAMASAGVVIESCGVSQRGPVRTLKLLKDWATHEDQKLE